MKLYPFLILLFIMLYSCEKLEEPIPVQIINTDNSTYSETFVKAIENKLNRRNFQIVNHSTNYVLEISNFDVDSYYDYETVYDDCDYGTYTYELLVEELTGFVSLFNGEEEIDSWKIEASQTENLKQGRPLILELLNPDDCEEDGNCDCTNYYIKSAGVFNIKSELKNEARKVANDMVDNLSF